MVSFTASTTKKLHAPSLGESRSHAVRRFLSLERSLHAKDEFEEFDSEYFDMKHAKPVPTADLEKPTCHILINLTLQEAFLRACSYKAENLRFKLFHVMMCNCLSEFWVLWTLWYSHLSNVLCTFIIVMRTNLYFICFSSSFFFQVFHSSTM